MSQARIYQPTKTAMQSGKGKTNFWILEFVPENTRFIDPIMGWTGSSDMKATEVKLKFSSKEEAIEYANSKGLKYELIEPKLPSLKINSYSKNFL